MVRVEEEGSRVRVLCVFHGGDIQLELRDELNALTACSPPF